MSTSWCSAGSGADHFFEVEVVVVSRRWWVGILGIGKVVLGIGISPMACVPWNWDFSCSGSCGGIGRFVIFIVDSGYVSWTILLCCIMGVFVPSPVGNCVDVIVPSKRKQLESTPQASVVSC